ncbi:MAG: hypothetical protein KF770_16120 [Anaerolineae bacterium]|nr:hypothetical protein [Anaerolineae bacterium]
MDVNLHIERLVLDGITLSARERAVLGTAVSDELTRLINEGGLPANLPASGIVPSIPAGAIQLDNDNNPARLGQQIAQAVFGGNGR